MKRNNVSVNCKNDGTVPLKGSLVNVGVDELLAAQKESVRVRRTSPMNLVVVTFLCQIAGGYCRRRH